MSEREIDWIGKHEILLLKEVQGQVDILLMRYQNISFSTIRLKMIPIFVAGVMGEVICVFIGNPWKWPV